VQFRAVIFDLGGVVFPSPFAAFRAYEEAHGLPHRFISETVVRGGDDGAWSRFERGEFGLDQFAPAFEAECAAAGGTVVVADLFGRMAGGTGGGPSGGAGGDGGAVPEMVTAITTIRAHGLLTAALTNNWVDTDGSTHVSGDTPMATELDGLFDTIVESARVGLRKPDPRIYELVCERLGVTPHESVFLDDLGTNLKSARAMGMTTIKVDDPVAAVQDLGAVLGLDLGLDQGASTS
jgi:epoxide hydrolase-like predicted phosphatase